MSLKNQKKKRFRVQIADLRAKMSKVIEKSCEACGVPFKTEKSRFCSRECRSGVYKGGKTCLEIERESISRLNNKWLTRKTPWGPRPSPDLKTFTNY
jgi:hypothetical protein